MKKILLPTLVVLLAAGLRLSDLASLPPGLFYDESANGIDALRVLGGAHPVFFAGDQGREALTIYLQAATIAAIGPSPFALRLPLAALGILTVPCTYALFRAFAGRRVGLIGAALLAVSYWHVSLSRLAFRADALPLLTTLSAYWTWKAVRSGRIGHFAIAGISLGIGLYTYIPARLALPLIGLWVVGCALIPPWRGKTSQQRILVGGGVALLVLAVVAFPLARYFYLHPHDFIERIQNATNPSPGVTPFDGFLRAILGLFWIGDPNIRHNLPGRPLVDVTVTLVGIVGLGLAIRRWRDATSIFLVVWCLAMLVPAALTDEPAHALRLAGELPFILFFPAIGLAWLASLPLLVRRGLGTVAITLLVVISGIATARDYFLVWPSQPALAAAFQADLLHSLSLVPLVPPGSSLLVTSDVYESEPIPLSFVPAAQARARAFDGRDVLVMPATAASPVYYLYAPSFEPTGGIPSWFPLARVATSHDSLGRVDGELFRAILPATLPSPKRSVNAVIAGAVEVTGADFTPLVRPGEPTTFGLRWTVRGNLPAGNWEFFAHLVDRSQHQVWAEDYNYGFPPNQWRAGDRVISWFTLPVSADAPATVTDVTVGLFDPDTGQRLDVTTPSGQPAGNALLVGPVRIDRPVAPPPPQHPLAVKFGDAIKLLGYDLEPRADGGVTLSLHWQASTQPDQDYTVFVHRLDAQGKDVADADGQPGAGAFPTSTWGPGEEFVDVHSLPSGSLAPGTGKIEVGLYLLATGQRLPVIGSDGASQGDSLSLPP